MEGRQIGPVDSDRGIWVSPDRKRVVLLEPRTLATEAALRVITVERNFFYRFVVPVMARAAARSGDPASPPEGSTCPGDLPNPVEVQFRPGTEEIWVGTMGLVTVLHPDGRHESWRGDFRSFHPIPRLDGQVLTFDVSQGPEPLRFDPAFSSNGQYFAYRLPTGELRLASAAFSLEPADLGIGGSHRVLGIGEIASGHLVSWSYQDNSALDRSRIDLHLAFQGGPPGPMTIRDVRQVLFGRDRLLAITQAAAREPFAPGALDLLDLRNYSTVRVASNVTELLPLPGCDGCDATAPGATVAYVVHARYPWQHDGLWAVSLP
jgi:hypothetical protein